jgi:hypothetical protein
MYLNLWPRHVPMNNAFSVWLLLPGSFLLDGADYDTATAL